ncbi:amino acid ABC transporter membrane protein 2 (PAAT family) [Tamaricihabitans halophyticus]|uniref:Amino acid ABC transporter membrane protein 2 (PAAT family) n=1 Tax=Tamaricihabitans halophyticus TaxID=1262583 RepID=A0A4R2R0S0_9PSEU|nr:amino acid ABC transporter permease [Tamaricihabitans halophyticus]TCP55169.1 amino acid ABC transporter membrane protein 2 (PAAT family) [Tamaricihabitans halophyticus]
MSSVLYDAPGPKAKARHRMLAVLGILALAGALGYVGYKFYESGEFVPSKWEWLQYEQIQIDLAKAVLATLQAFASGAVLALVFGAIFAIARLSDHVWIRAFATVIVEFFRAIPLLVMIFLFYFGLPVAGVEMTPYLAVVLGLMLYNGSVLAEVFRAGVLALPKGQQEAAYALGMRKTQVMVTVLLPQAIRSMMPTIISQLVVLLKDTALGFLITYQELLYYARNLGSQGVFDRPIVPTTIVIAAIYIVLCLLLTWLANYLDKRQNRSKKHIDLDDDKKPDATLADAR